MSNTSSRFAGCILSATVLATTTSWAGDMATYKITITNLTPGQPIAPALATTHHNGMSFFKTGTAPSSELADLAEAGNSNPMAAKLLATPGFSDAQVTAGGIAPGGSIIMTINAYAGDRLSLGAMLGNTNDGFIAIRNVSLPRSRQTAVYMATGYDAGTETNDESCSTVPGPACGGAALSPEDAGEGVVVVHNGIHGIGGLSAAMYDWRNPVAQIVIQRAE